MTDDDNVLLHLRRTYAKDEMVSYVVRRIKELKVELGQANAEIDHLNDELSKAIKSKALNEELSKEVRIETKKEEIYKQCRTEIISLKAKNKRLMADNKDLIMKLISKNDNLAGRV